MAVEPRRPDDEDEDGPYSPPLIEDGVVTPLHLQHEGRWYALKRNSKCKTCTSPHRMAIEELLVQGYSAEAVITELARRNCDAKDIPTRWSVRNHIEVHSPLHVIQSRAIRDESMKALGDAYSQNIPGYVNTLGGLQMLVQQGIRQMSEQTVSPETLLAALKHLAQYETRTISGDLTVDAAMGMLKDFIDITANFIPLEAQQQWSHALMSNPGIQALVEEAERETVEAQRQITS